MIAEWTGASSGIFVPTPQFFTYKSSNRQAADMNWLGLSL